MIAVPVVPVHGAGLKFPPDTCASMSQPRPPLVFDRTKTAMTLFEALLQASKLYGAKKIIIEDQDRQPLTYRRLILGSLVLGGKLAALTQRNEAVGLLLPSANGLAVALFGLNAFGRVPALLNFTAGLRNMTAAVKTAMIRTIVTSRRFVEIAKLEDVVAGLSAIEVSPGKRVRFISRMSKLRSARLIRRRASRGDCTRRDFIRPMLCGQIRRQSFSSRRAPRARRKVSCCRTAISCRTHSKSTHTRVAC